VRADELKLGDIGRNMSTTVGQFEVSGKINSMRNDPRLGAANDRVIIVRLTAIEADPDEASTLAMFTGDLELCPDHEVSVWTDETSAE
jgi:hypothetical protein